MPEAKGLQCISKLGNKKNDIGIVFSVFVFICVLGSTLYQPKEEGFSAPCHTLLQRDFLAQTISGNKFE